VPIEGKYWKRRLEAVASEYKRWRLFYKQKRSFNQRKLFQGEISQADAVSVTGVDLHWFIILFSGEYGCHADYKYDGVSLTELVCCIFIAFVFNRNVPNNFYFLEDIQGRINTKYVWYIITVTCCTLDVPENLLCSQLPFLLSSHAMG